MGYIYLQTNIPEFGNVLKGCEVRMDCDANIAEFISSAVALLVSCELKVPQEHRQQFRCDFLELLNEKRKEEGL